MNAQTILETAKKIRSAKSTLDKMTIMKDVPSRQHEALMKAVEELGTPKQGVEPYTNKKGDTVGVTVHAEYLPNRGLFIPNKAIANWSDLNQALDEYRTNSNHAF